MRREGPHRPGAPGYAEDHAHAQILLTMGVLSIILTVPLLAVLIAVTGRAWLQGELDE